MKNNKLFVYKNQIHRVLTIKDDKCLVINCIKLSMPFWLDNSILEEPSDETPVLKTVYIDSLPPETQKAAHKRYQLVAPILPFVDDDYMRSHIISRLSEENEISKQTIRKYLCLFLAYQDIGCLAPQKPHTKSLTQDEKNFRWALNKFYYSPLKHTLKASYLLLLKEKYSNDEGTLYENYPPFHRFRYFYNKTKKTQNEIISRYGLSAYDQHIATISTSPVTYLFL